MNIEVQPGRYIVAVSGGVDSVVLLHRLINVPGLRLTVAHYDHGIRDDSQEDRRLVQRLAKKYGLPFVYQSGNLGAQASEAQAREARYHFLNQARKAANARAIITAHHQDDVLETIILNLLRGTGRRGLSSLKDTNTIKRPLLHLSKKELLRYAKREGLEWHEDSTNSDERYLRNYIRKNIMPRFASKDREALLIVGGWAAKQNAAIANKVVNYLHMQPSPTVLDRHGFVMLPHAVAREIMGEWLLQNTDAELSSKLLERLVSAAKTGRAGSKIDINSTYWLKILGKTLALELRER